MKVSEMNQLEKIRVPKEMVYLFKKLLRVGWQNLKDDDVLIQVMLSRGIEPKELGLTEKQVEERLGTKAAKRVAEILDIPFRSLMK